MIEAPVICDSINPQGSRLHTQRWTGPKFIHQESLRHRAIYFLDFLHAEFDADFSFSVSSSRAIPFERLATEASDPALMAKPVHWGAAQKGMSPTDEEVDNQNRNIEWGLVLNDLGLERARTIPIEWITKRQCVERLWELGGQLDVQIARAMVEYTDVHKSIANRQIESHIHVHCLATATTNGWMNFFGLRLDKAADLTLRALAEEAWKGWNENVPKKLEPSQWHLPFIDGQDIEETGATSEDEWQEVLPIVIKVSVARCAHLSYESFDSPGTRMSVEKCVELHNRFVNSVPMHASPMEHQATPDHELVWRGNWANPKEAGNLGPGWRQYRKMLPNEAVAPLPEAYR